MEDITAEHILVIRSITEGKATLWEIGDERSGRFVPWAASSSSEVVQRFISRERARSPDLIIDDRRRRPLS
jgi:hypothetical protein